MAKDIISGRSMPAPEREAELLRLARNGDASARSELILCNMKLVARQAHDLADKGLEFDDLMSEGIIGLMRAIDKFLPERGTRLSTYAVPWIREMMLRAIAGSEACVHVPDYVVSRHVSISKRRQALTQELGREPDAYETAEACRGEVRGISCERDVEKVLEFVRTSRNAVFLDAPSGKDGDISLHELIPGGFPAPDAECDRDALTDEIEAVMDECLDEREKLVIRLRFGLGVSSLGIARGTVVPQRQACTIIGTSAARVDQIRNIAVRKMQGHENGRLALFLSSL